MPPPSSVDVLVYGATPGGIIAALAARISTLGVPDEEADLLSYVYFDRFFTARLVELGRADAQAQQDAILELLSG